MVNGPHGGLSTPQVGLVPLHPPCPTWPQQGDDFPRGLIPAHGGADPLGAGPGQDWARLTLRPPRTVGSAVLPPPAVLLFTAWERSPASPGSAAQGPAQEGCMGVPALWGFSGATLGFFHCPEIPGRFRTRALEPASSPASPDPGAPPPGWAASFLLSLEGSCPFLNTVPSGCVSGSARIRTGKRDTQTFLVKTEAHFSFDVRLSMCLCQHRRRIRPRGLG